MYRVISSLILLFVACNLPAPQRNLKDPGICWQWEKCMYWSQKGKDKSSCQTALNECTKMRAFEYCKEPANRIKIKGQTRTGLVEGDDFFAGCWSIIK